MRVLANPLPRSWSAALVQLKRDVTAVGGRLAGHHPSPLVKGFPRSEAPPSALPAASEVRGRAAARELVIVRAIRETADAVTLVLRDPERETFAFRPGQFFTLLTEIDGEIVPRNYSASNAPFEAELHLTLKKKSGGRVSPVLSVTQPGARLRVLGPFGSFVVPARSSPAPRRLVLIAGGAGITPLASIARTILASEPDAELALVYANRREEDIILAAALQALVAAHGPRLTLLHVLEEPPPRWEGEVGRLDLQTAARALEKLTLAAHPDAVFFVCGPDPMRDQVLEALASRGISTDAIHIERFAIGKSAQGRELVVLAVGERTDMGRDHRGGSRTGQRRKNNSCNRRRQIKRSARPAKGGTRCAGRRGIT